jgi:ATP-dependent DNA helicase RecG
MGLPVNIESLVHGNTIEWERLEFKRGWNPEDVIHSMCAFANDINNWGGGYIIIGIEENNGQPVLPPAGLQQNQIDRIQGEVIRLSNQIQPNYFPVYQPYVLQDRHILVLWCPAGDNRPYTAPATLGQGNNQRNYYIRSGSRSIIARGENLRRLQELTARVPFDDRINHQASLDDLDLGLIRAFLQEVKSDLFTESINMPFPDLCRTMRIAKGPDEDLRPVNVGLLFFNREPDQFFQRAWIELAWHKGTDSRNYKEYYFKGPLHKQLRDTLSFFKSNIISEEVKKQSGKAEADRFFNFPYDAIEEALSNAVYHKSYELESPIEVQVWPDKIEILSHPGPVPPVNADVLRSRRRIVAREYRNRRIGDFLKELHLTEGRGTGFPTIYDAMAANGSPKPIFETDENTYFLVTLPVHPQASVGASDQAGDQASGADGNQATNQVNELIFNDLEDVVAFTNGVTNQATNQAGNQAREIVKNEIHDKIRAILELAFDWTKRSRIFDAIGLTNQTFNRKKYLDPLLDLGWVEMEFPEKKTSPEQRYKTTESGERLLKLISQE